MSTSLTAVQQIEFDALVKAEYQSLGFLLRDTVRVRRDVIGATVSFRKVGQVQAVPTGYLQTVVIQDPDYSQTQAILQKYTAPTAVDSVQELTVNFDAKMENAMLVANALGRRSDQIIIDAMGVSPGSTIVNGGEGVGSVSQEAAKVYNDIGYFLSHDGVYKWDSEGITCVTNGLVRTWFTTDTYFNRSMFWRATAEIDSVAKKYYLFLASRGSDVLDRWVEMDLLTGSWYGPHKTDAFTPSCTLLVAGRNQKPYYMVGSREGYISQPQEARNDWGLFPIDFQVTMRGEEMEDPEQVKYFGELSVHVEPQDSGTLTITPALGDVDETTATAAMTADLTQARTRVGRVGSGNSMVLDFTNSELDVDVALYGYEVDPVNPVGRR